MTPMEKFEPLHAARVLVSMNPLAMRVLTTLRDARRARRDDEYVTEGRYEEALWAWEKAGLPLNSDVVAEPAAEPPSVKT